MSRHGYCFTRVYRIWVGMKNRCQNPRSRHYTNYGARGVRVCERWQRFENFLADMGDPAPSMTIDRINNEGDYEPTNCRWATYDEQACNKRNNCLLESDGEILPLTIWARRLNIHRTTLRRRINKGWTMEKVVSSRDYRFNEEKSK